METNLLKEFGIDFEAYCAKPTQKETTKILTLLINNILQEELATSRSVIEICRIVNSLLPRMNSKIKFLYHDLLEPHNGTVTAVKQLYLIAAKLRLACNNNVLSEMNEIQETIKVLLHKNQEALEYENTLNSNSHMINLKQIYQANLDQLESEERNLQEEEKKLQALNSTLKQLQDKKEFLAVQLQDKTDNCAIRDEMILKQTNLYKGVSSYDSKKWQLQLKIEVNNQVESMSKTTAPEVHEIDINFIKNIEKLNDLTIQSLKIYSDNDELSDKHFSIEKSNINIKKQIEALHNSKLFEEQNNILQIKKLKDMMDLIVNEKDECNKLQSDAVKLYNQVWSMNERCKQYLAIKASRDDQVKSFQNDCLIKLQKAQDMIKTIQNDLNNGILFNMHKT